MPNLAHQLEFACTRCGECCRGLGKRVVALFPGDAARIAGRLGLSEDEVLARYCTRRTQDVDGVTVGLVLLRHLDGACVFLAEDNTCSIHEHKPEQCRRTPFGFLWDGERPYACMESVAVPDGHDTIDDDAALFKGLVGGTDPDHR